MESAAQSIVSKLGQLVVEELQEIRGVGDKIVLLTDELATMNAVLRMTSEADESAVDHLVGEWEKQVRELASDAEDCADIYRLRVNRPIPGKFLPYVLKWPKYQLEKLRSQRNLAADVKALLAPLPRSPRFAPVSAASASASARLRRADDDPDHQLVGIREQADTLAQRIKEIHADDDNRLKVFSIVGFGGLGKTTLAMELCRQLEADFERRAGGPLARLLLQIGKVKQDEDAGRTHANQLNIDQMDVEGLSTKLNELLVDKRYLVVIDDVWSLQAWEAIHIRLPENNCGSRIIVTTRIETVAKASSVSEDLVHRMKPLEQNASENLFVKIVFGSVGACLDGLKDTMSKILNKCGGLPLAIVKIASILASYNSVESVETWIRVSNSIGSQMENHPTLEGMRQVITLSYGYLPHHLKACMLYLSIFPEDYVIAKDRLLYRWIAEGLVAEKRGLTLFDVAEEYFDELISRNMIQLDKLPRRSWTYYGYRRTEEVCRVHDIMLEVMVSKSQEANFVCLVGRQYGGGGLARGLVRRLSVHGNVEDEEERSSSGRPPNNNNNKKAVEQRRRVRRGGIEAMNLQHVRSLGTFEVEKGLGKLLDRLGEFRLLRLLDLEGCKSLRNKHMRDVCRLYLVRFLSLRGTLINVIPSEIGDLECLESLDVQETRIHSMPPTVTKLSKLERLRVDRLYLPLWLGNMKALRKIGELQRLQFLCIELENSRWDPNKEEFLHELASSLSKTYALRTLHLSATDQLMDFLLQVSSPPPLLWSLIFRGHISRFPGWISSLKHLAEFSVDSTGLAGDELLGSLNGSYRGPELVTTKDKFPALRILDVSSSTFEQHTSIVGIDNLNNLKEVKFRGSKFDPWLESALYQVHETNKNRHKSNQIKVVVVGESW
uniref:AAA+ ATPase domain-containing protein n=1 Tax=Setaria italica TaxID=4555 RepID=K3YXW4_SETIT